MTEGSRGPKDLDDRRNSLTEGSRDSRRRRATAEEVARAAGVSRSAVSRTFTPGASVAPATRSRVLEAADRLGYRPNALAQMLIRQRSEIVGVILGSLTNQFLSTLSALLLERLQAAGYRTLLFQARSRGELDALLPTVMRYQVEAIVVTGFTPDPAAAERCANAGAPVLLVNRAPGAAFPGIAIATDHRAGGRLAARLLLGAGYGRIAAVVGDLSMSTHRARLAGLEEGLAEAGGALSATMSVPFSHEGGMEGGTRLLSQGPRPDAVFCSGDVLAFGALDAARSRLGLGIPGDLGVLGFDDVPMAAWPAYALSTIRQPVAEIAAETVATLDRLRSGEAQLGASLLLAPGFVPRASLRGVPPDEERRRPGAAPAGAAPAGSGADRERR